MNLIILATALALASTGNLMITEVQIRGDSPSESHITIFNQSNNDIDISGFKIRKKSSTGREYSVRVFPKENKIFAGGYFTWSNSRNDYHLKIDADTWSTAGISNDNSIGLFSPSNKIIDSLAWGDGDGQFLSGSPIPVNPNNDQIIKRKTFEGRYENTGDNSADFFLYPETIIDIMESDLIQHRSQEKRDNQSPVAIGAGIVILSSFSILMLKKSIS